MILKSNKIRDFNEGEVFYKALNSSFTAKNRDVLIILSRQARYAQNNPNLRLNDFLRVHGAR